jgi:hypothetical protein
MPRHGRLGNTLGQPSADSNPYRYVGNRPATSTDPRRGDRLKRGGVGGHVIVRTNATASVNEKTEACSSFRRQLQRNRFQARGTSTQRIGRVFGPSEAVLKSRSEVSWQTMAAHKPGSAPATECSSYPCPQVLK